MEWIGTYLARDIEERLSVGGGDLKVILGEGGDALAELHGEFGAMVCPLLEAADRRAVETVRKTVVSDFQDLKCSEEMGLTCPTRGASSDMV